MKEGSYKWWELQTVFESHKFEWGLQVLLVSPFRTVKKETEFERTLQEQGLVEQNRNPRTQETEAGRS